MALHHQAQLAYGKPLGQSYGEAVKITQGLGAIQQQRDTRAETQRLRGAEQRFSEIAGQFKGNPKGALEKLRELGLVSGQQYFAGLQGIHEKERAAQASQRKFAEQKRQFGVQEERYGETAERTADFREARLEQGTARAELTAEYRAAQDRQTTLDRAARAKHWAASDAAALQRSTKQSTSDERMTLSSGITNTLKTYEGHVPKGYENWPVAQQVVYMIKDSGKMAALRDAADSGDRKAIADLGYVLNAVEKLQSLSGAPPGEVPPAPAPVGGAAGPQQPRFMFDIETGVFTPK